jgi:tricarballylate dehydrogenase
LFVAKVATASKGLADLDYCRVLEREVPTTLRFLEAHGVKLLHYGPPVAMGVQHEITPEGGGRAIVEALARSLEQSGAAEILYRTEAVRLSLGEDGRVAGVVVRGEDGLQRTLAARAVTLACGGFEGNKEMLTR